MADFDAKFELIDVLDQLRNLSDIARGLVAEHYPNELSRLEAYDALNFGDSKNPYDTTFAKFIDELDQIDELEEL